MPLTDFTAFLASGVAVDGTTDVILATNNGIFFRCSKNSDDQYSAENCVNILDISDRVMPTNQEFAQFGVLDIDIDVAPSARSSSQKNKNKNKNKNDCDCDKNNTTKGASNQLFIIYTTPCGMEQTYSGLDCDYYNGSIRVSRFDLFKTPSGSGSNSNSRAKANWNLNLKTKAKAKIQQQQQQQQQQRWGRKIQTLGSNAVVQYDPNSEFILFEGPTGPSLSTVHTGASVLLATYKKNRVLLAAIGDCSASGRVANVTDECRLPFQESRGDNARHYTLCGRCPDACTNPLVENYYGSVIAVDPYCTEYPCKTTYSSILLPDGTPSVAVAKGFRVPYGLSLEPAVPHDDDDDNDDDDDDDDDGDNDSCADSNDDDDNDDIVTCNARSCNSRPCNSRPCNSRSCNKNKNNNNNNKNKNRKNSGSKRTQTCPDCDSRNVLISQVGERTIEGVYRVPLYKLIEGAQTVAVKGGRQPFSAGWNVREGPLNYYDVFVAPVGSTEVAPTPDLAWGSPSYFTPPYAYYQHLTLAGGIGDSITGAFYYNGPGIPFKGIVTADFTNTNETQNYFYVDADEANPGDRFKVFDVVNADDFAGRFVIRSFPAGSKRAANGDFYVTMFDLANFSTTFTKLAAQ